LYEGREVVLATGLVNGRLEVYGRREEMLGCAPETEGAGEEPADCWAW